MTRDAPAVRDDHAMWMHDLRNAVNAMAMVTALLRRRLELDEIDRVRELALTLERECERCLRALDDEPHP